MLRTFLVACLVSVMFASVAVAQTTPPAPNPNQGAFDKLSPGNQKIAQALFDAQQSNSTATTSTTTKPLSRDDIAAMKQDGKGWGEIFKEMRKEGLVQEKNLGQVVRQESGKAGRKDIAEDRRDIKEDKQDTQKDRQDLQQDRQDVRNDARDLRQDRQPRKASSGTSITTGSGKTFVAGAKVKPESASVGVGQNGNDHRPQFTGDHGSLSSGAGAAHSSAGGQGGRGKN